MQFIYTNFIPDAEQWTLPNCCCFCLQRLLITAPQHQQQHHQHEPCVLLEGVGAIRFVKFIIVTLVSIVLMHHIIRWLVRTCVCVTGALSVCGTQSLLLLDCLVRLYPSHHRSQPP
jgi:hypothetical protein